MSFFRDPIPAEYQPYITARPVCTTYKLQSKKDRMIILGSDGLFQWITNDELVQHLTADVDALEGDASPLKTMVAQCLVNFIMNEKVCLSRTARKTNHPGTNVNGCTFTGDERFRHVLNKIGSLVAK